MANDGQKVNAEKSGAFAGLPPQLRDGDRFPYAVAAFVAFVFLFGVLVGVVIHSGAGVP